jgi:hypothetical protein
VARPWRGDGTALLGALTGHASLRMLDLSMNGHDDNPHDAEHAAATGAALGALVGANAPALTALDVSVCSLGDDGLRPLFDQHALRCRPTRT